MLTKLNGAGAILQDGRRNHSTLVCIRSSLCFCNVRSSCNQQTVTATAVTTNMLVDLVKLC